MGHDHFDRFELWFSMNREHNLPTAFSTVLILMAATTAIIARRLSHAGRRHVAGWTVLTLALSVIAFDEWFQVHEKVGGAMHDRLDLSSPLRFPWVLPYLVLALGFVVVVLPMLREPRVGDPAPIRDRRSGLRRWRSRGRDGRRGPLRRQRRGGR